MFSPLEGFEVKFFFGFGELHFTNSTLYLLLVFGILSGFLYLNSFRALVVPSFYQIVVEEVYGFLLSMIKEQTHGSALCFFPLFLLLFLFVLISNLLGLIPFAFTVTAQLAVTFLLALSANLGFFLLGVFVHGFSFFKLFLPSGAPLFLVPLIVVIEVVSYLIRTFSLAIRLFANMMAGHTLLHILSSFAIKLAALGFVGTVVSMLPFLLVMAVFLLELGIAFIQAYVFVILLCIYINDSYNPVH